MNDLLRTAPAPSPCIGVCQLDSMGRYCIGCLRTLGEIGEWSSASELRKRAILDRIDRQRRTAGTSAASN
jgi:predicted Fe-S protein YdhL (DUF1289 family)